MKKVIIGVLTVISVFLGIQVIRELPMNTSDKHDKEEYETIVKGVSDYEQACSQMNERQFQKIIKKQDINLDQAKQNLNNQINQGLDLAYNHTHNDNDYKNLKKALPKIVGKSLSNVIINNAMPTTTQNGLIYPLFNLVSVNISYGDFNMMKKTIPVQILVHYKLNTGKGTTDGYGLYSGTYNVNKKELLSIQYMPMQSAQQQLNRNGGNN